MTFTPRFYQNEAVDALFDYWRDGGGNPIIEMATGTGKSGVAGMTLRRLVSYKSDMRVGVIAHVQELIDQNARELIAVYPEASAKVGLYSAGLGRADHGAQFLFGGIQSIYKKAKALGKFDVLMVDEGHLVPRKSDTMYGRFIAECREENPQLRLAAMTATPYRLDSGRLDEGEGRIFDKIVYSYDIGRGIGDGYLSPLTSKFGSVEIDVEGVPIRGGEFLEKALQERALNPDLIIAACRETVAYFRQTNRRKAMIFCTGIAHAFAVAETMNALGVKTGVVTGEMSRTVRADTIKAFADGLLECLVNVAVLTTGFNVKGVDLIAFMLSTLSTGKYVQIIGRGTRLVIDVSAIHEAQDRRAAIAASIKPDCLILDYGGNFRRHGAIDDIHGLGASRPKADDADDKSEADSAIKVKADTIRARQCEECRNLLPLKATACKCGWQVPMEQILIQHAREAENGMGVTKSEERPDWREVTGWDFSRHEKPSKPPSLRIDFWGPDMRGRNSVSEWLPLESESQWARGKAGTIWRDLCGDTPPPASVAEALGRTDELTCPVQILVRKRDGFTEVATHSMPAAPVADWRVELDDEIPF